MPALKSVCRSSVKQLYRVMTFGVLGCHDCHFLLPAQMRGLNALTGNTRMQFSCFDLHRGVLLSSALISWCLGISISCVLSSQKTSLLFLVSSHCRPRRNPIFAIDLVLDNSGVHFSPPAESFKESLLSLLDKGILVTHAIPQLEKVTILHP